jgi:hypothetical protein
MHLHLVYQTLVYNHEKRESNEMATESTVGVLFFVHPKPPLFDVYQEQLKAMFVGKPIPKFKIRRYKVKSGEESTDVLLIQTVQDKAQEVSPEFEEANDKNPYEFVSWRAWLSLHSSNKSNGYNKDPQQIFTKCPSSNPSYQDFGMIVRPSWEK